MADGLLSSIWVPVVSPSQEFVEIEIVKFSKRMMPGFRLVEHSYPPSALHYIVICAELVLHVSSGT